MTIQDLNADELRGLIYNNFGGKTMVDHPVFCASCGKGNKTKDALAYLCRGCEVEDAP